MTSYIVYFVFLLFFGMIPELLSQEPVPDQSVSEPVRQFPTPSTETPFRKTLTHPGIILTFDDSHNIKNWIRFLDLFKKYNAKATFFINAPQNLTETDIANLKTLIDAGFAVGSHGTRHVKSVDYINEHGETTFLNDEIYPAHETLKRFGITPCSFAYPMSQHNEQTDAVLSTLYRHARSGASIPDGKNLAESDLFFTPLDQIARRFTLVGKGCDMADETFLEQELFPALERVRDRSEILTLYAHNIATEGTSHFIHCDILEKILQKANELDLAFYTFNELPSDYPPPSPSSDSELVIMPGIITEGFDRETCWVHARAAKIPNGEAVLTTQKLLLSGSDVFYAIHSAYSSDNGISWSPLEKQPGLDRESPAEGIEICPCDGTPAWHEASQKILLTGHLAHYEKNKISSWRPEPVVDSEGLVPSCLWYSVYDAATHTWSDLALLEVPKTSPLYRGGAGCVQRLDLKDGTILIPFYTPCDETPGCSQVIVAHCSFDGQKLRYLEEGTPLRLNVPRGLGEPSLTEFNGKFYLTLRNDRQGYVAQSDDGLHFTEPVPWRWKENQVPIGNANTQQHWLKCGGKLWLVYTRKTETNQHVFRNRAPLFIAQVCPETLTLIQSTEQIVVPERGARLGNFGVTEISDNESWVVVSEWMQSPRGGGEPGVSDCMAHGSNNAIWLSRVSFAGSADK